MPPWNGMNVNWLANTYVMGSFWMMLSKRKQYSGAMKNINEIITDMHIQYYDCFETLLGKLFLLVHRVILIIGNFGARYCEIFCTNAFYILTFN